MIKRTYRLRYFAQELTIGVLAVVGLIALSGEPAANDPHYALTAILQLLTLFGSFAAAGGLYFRWGLYELNKRINNLKNKQND